MRRPRKGDLGPFGFERRRPNQCHCPRPAPGCPTQHHPSCEWFVPKRDSKVEPGPKIPGYKARGIT